jgi:tRNA modification GTPase
MTNHQTEVDTIIAPGTPPGASALAVLRLSGTGSRVLTEQLLARSIDWTPQLAQHVALRNGDQILDDVVLTYWKEPKSFTGEDSVEISCHGNPLIVQNILRAYLEKGARLAEPGEFTQRAFLNGKLDLTQAEAVLDVIAAGSERSLRGAQAMKEGKLAHRLNEMRTRLIDLLSHLEAHIDFPEEGISPETGSQFFKGISEVRDEAQALLDTAPLGRVLREGVATAIVGAPNVGKSSLLNALLRENRAIVSPHPGTTRDTIEAECNLRGWRLRLIDTAGQHETNDPVETEGIRRARSAMTDANLILHVVEGQLSAESDVFDRSELRLDQLYLKIGNKSDLGWHTSQKEALPISIKTGKGLPEMETAIEQLLLKSSPDMEQLGWLTINARQEAALRRALTAFDHALAGLKNDALPELISIDLRAALNEIGQIVGLATNDDILEQLFKNFCIGK